MFAFFLKVLQWYAPLNNCLSVLEFLQVRVPLIVPFVSLSFIAACSGGGGGGAETDPVFGGSLPEQFNMLSMFSNNTPGEEDIAPETSLTGTAEMSGNVYVPLDNPGTNIIVGDMEADFDFSRNTLSASATNFNEYEFDFDLDGNDEVIVGSESATLLYEFAGTLEGDGIIYRNDGPNGETVYLLAMGGEISGTRDFGALGEQGFSATVSADIEGIFLEPGQNLQTLGFVYDGELIFDLENSATPLVEDLFYSDAFILLSE
ncbi:hypothetical protein [Thalassococcus halodurans]|uniref:hypothetical protein n=1 Tax=Thalassococcus halodurans TaxID=373675 RepID=UPI0011B07C43|nr:hypothetical protein [Thalassococcus halodurans]